MIQFPRLHIAESVTNRILNIADQLRTQRPAPVTPAAPSMPSADPLSPAIDAGLSAPQPPVTADDGVAEQISLKGLA